MLYQLLNPRRLQIRIAAVFLGLLMLLQATSYWFIQDSINTNARGAITAKLEQENTVFMGLLKMHAETLEKIAQAIQADPAWEANMSKINNEDILSILSAHSRILPKGVLIYTNADKQTIHGFGMHGERLSAAIQKDIHAAMAANLATDPSVAPIVKVGEESYQSMILPLHHDNKVHGWLSVITPIDRALLIYMKALSGMDVMLIHEAKESQWDVLKGTLAKAYWPDLSKEWPLGNPTKEFASLHLGQEEFGTHAFTLPSSKGHTPMSAVLLSSVKDSLAPFEPLKFKLLMLSAMGFLLFGYVGFYTAQRITRPLRALADSARKLELGDYDCQIPITTHDEVGDLAHSFEAMRLAVQTRETEIRHLAFHDSLTDLPNREQFRQDLRQAIAQAQKDSTCCSVLLLDIDRFKHINDVLGHRFGDRLLKALAERVCQEALAPHDIMARLGGDEFGILLTNTDTQQAQMVADRVQKSLDKPIMLDDHKVDLGAGLGISTCPANGLDADALLSRAEVAMFTAKAQKSGTVIYHSGLDSSSEESLTLLSELRYAASNNQLRLYLQPKVNAKDGRVIGAEALVRWAHPVRGLVPPMHFIPFAEKAGFIRVLTHWMLEETIKMSKQLVSNGLLLKLSLNLSTRDLMDLDLPKRIGLLTQTYGVNPALICLEITESAIMDDPQRAQQTLERLSLMGFNLSIDDFGTGYSSLAYLKRLPVNELKIDKSFVMHMETDIQDAKIVLSTVDLAHNLGLSVVAEGVESGKCWRLLQKLNCDELQGFFIAKPMPANTFIGWVKQWKAPDTSKESLNDTFAALI